MQIEFNESLDLHRMRTLNQSMMDIYIEPALNNRVNVDFLNLTYWNFTKFQNRMLTVQLYF